MHCEKLGKLLHEETEIHVLSFKLQSVCNSHLADFGVLAYFRFAPIVLQKSFCMTEHKFPNCENARFHVVTATPRTN